MYFLFLFFSSLGNFILYMQGGVEEVWRLVLQGHAQVGGEGRRGDHPHGPPQKREVI